MTKDTRAKPSAGALRAAECIELYKFTGIDAANIIDRETGVGELLEAARLTALHFKRSLASGNFMGDDEHEAWTALNKAIAKCESGTGSE